MPVAAEVTLGAWSSYYVITGSAAGALTGLQFVVLTIAAESRTVREDSVSAFGSPNVFHFCAALLIAAILSVPWHTLGEAGAAVAVCGAAGVIYGGIVLRRALRQRGYDPVLEDWVWHTILPAVAYATLLVGGARAAAAPVPALFAVAAAELLLLFIGIHNAWDTVMYLMVAGARESGEAGVGPRQPAGPAAPAPAPPAPGGSSRAPLPPGRPLG